MRFKTDENLPVNVADLLRQHGHDACTVLDQQLGGHPDPDLAQVCLSESRALVKLDLDFSNILRFPPERYPGIVVLRPAVQTIPALLSMMHGVISLLRGEPLDKRLWIVDEQKVRVRGPRR